MLSLFSDVPLESRRDRARRVAISVGVHLVAVVALVGVIHRALQIAPAKMPGTTQGVRTLTYFSAGRPLQSISNLAQKKPAVVPTPTPVKALPSPVAPDVASAPASERGTGNSAESGAGQGQINIALEQYFPYPHPDLSTLPRGTSGDVILDAVVDETGKISTLTVVQGMGQSIDDYVIATVKQWSYKPANRNGTPVPSERELHFHYERG